MKRTVGLIAISGLVFAGCAQKDNDANGSPEGNAQENPPTQACRARRILIDSICLVDQQECWAAGCRVLNASENKFEAILFHTTDGGGSWQQVDVGVKQLSFDKVFFSDAQNGWLVCKDAAEVDPLFDQSAIIYRTGDGGVTWNQVLSVKSPYQS
jgi:hypothetical protein